MAQGTASGTITKALVSDAVESYIGGEVRPLSLTTDGRLRTTSIDAPTYMEFFTAFDFGSPQDIWTPTNSPWKALL